MQGSTNTQAKVPTLTSELTNDSGFITNTVDSLTNYYKKTETYTQTEVNALIAAIPTMEFKIVQTLPVTGETKYIYLVPVGGSTGNIYDEYIWVKISESPVTYGWEKIGTTAVDISNCVQYTTQSKSTAEKGVARSNINAEEAFDKNTAFNKNFGTSTPEMDGTGSAGTSTDVSRADHVHPTDTSRAGLAVATTSANGLMSSSDKTKLNNVIALSATTIATSSWVADSTYAGYNYKASIDNASITATHTPLVTFGALEATSGNYAPISSTVSGKVYVYAKTLPSSDVNVLSVILIP